MYVSRLLLAGAAPVVRIPRVIVRPRYGSMPLQQAYTILAHRSWHVFNQDAFADVAQG